VANKDNTTVIRQRNLMYFFITVEKQYKDNTTVTRQKIIGVPNKAKWRGSSCGRYLH
jgi:hypothetical protein